MRKCKIEIYSLTKEHILEIPTAKLVYPSDFKNVIFSFDAPEVKDGPSRILYNWFNTVYNFSGAPEEDREKFERFIRISFENDEMWELEGCWPTSINFGELDFSNSSPVEIEVTVIFKTLTIYFGGKKSLCIMK